MPEPRQRNGRWQARAHLGNGRYKTTTFRTYNEARIWTNRMEADHSRGLIATEQTTWSQASTLWLLSKRNIKESSRQSYQRGLNHLTTWDDRNVSTLRASDVEDFIGASPLDPRTLSTQIRPVMRGTFARCRRDGFMLHDPLVGVEWPRTGGSDGHRYLAQEEVDMVAEALSEPYRAMLIVFAYTGLRVGELLGLQGDDVVNGRINVRRQLTPSGVMDTPKNASSIREVPMSGRAANAIPHLDAKPLWAVNGTVPSRDTVRRRFAEGARLADVQPFRIHDLRHTCASWLIDAGANPLKVARWLGHAQVTQTLNTYAHLFPDDLDDLAGLL